jgi:membrane protein DedA with SNARE-associated domain
VGQGLRVRALLIAGLTLRLHHHFRGPTVDYVGLAAAAAASWVGIPGPGEPVLVAAGVFAAKHKLDISSVVFVAWLGATAGGVVGWIVGIKAGRAVITAPGPLRRLRRRAVAHGDDIFERHPVLAIMLTPSWIAGIHRVRTTVYLPINAGAAAVWAAAIGLGSYLVGPTVVEFANDIGLVTGIALAALVLTVVGGELLRRQRRARAAGATDPDPDPGPGGSPNSRAEPGQ